MIDDHTTEDCLSRGAQLNLYFAGTGGVTDVDTYWFGFYGDKEDNAFETISDKTASINSTNKYSKDENGNYIKLSNVDSGIAFSWQNIEPAAGESKEFSWVINVGSEAKPPQWSDTGVNLTVTADAAQDDLDINVAAKVKDEAGITDKLYYSVNGGDGGLLGGVIADGETEKSITGVVSASDWANGTYHLDFWVVNSKGAVSEKVRRTVTITDGRITGDVTVINPELSHDWNTDWSYDESNHWHDCRNANCTISANDEKDGFGAHEFDNSCDATCNICGYTRAITHTFNQKVMTERYLVSAGTCTKKRSIITPAPAERQAPQPSSAIWRRMSIATALRAPSLPRPVRATAGIAQALPLLRLRLAPLTALPKRPPFLIQTAGTAARLPLLTAAMATSMPAP